MGAIKKKKEIWISESKKIAGKSGFQSRIVRALSVIEANIPEVTLSDFRMDINQKPNRSTEAHMKGIENEDPASNVFPYGNFESEIERVVMS